MDNTAIIDDYFKGPNSNLQKEQFEKRINDDPSFAREVAFYLSAHGEVYQLLQEEKKRRFRELYNQQRAVPIKQRAGISWKYLAAASVLAATVALSWFFYGSKMSPQQLAAKYVQQNFYTLPVTMGNGDSLQAGLTLFNAGKLDAALSVFEALATKDTGTTDAEKYAGIVCLRLNDYDKAIEYFSRLESSDSYSNPGRFYKSLALMERNKPGDKAVAKQLLKQVFDNDQEGKKEAAEWLKEF